MRARQSCFWASRAASRPRGKCVRACVRVRVRSLTRARASVTGDVVCLRSDGKSFIAGDLM